MSERPDKVLEEYLVGKSAISRAYGAQSSEVPSAGIDDAIRAAARRAVGSRPRAAHRSAWFRWRIPLASAAVVLLSATVLFKMHEQNQWPRVQPTVPPTTSPAGTESAQEPLQQPATATDDRADKLETMSADRAVAPAASAATPDAVGGVMEQQHAAPTAPSTPGAEWRARAAAQAPVEFARDAGETIVGSISKESTAKPAAALPPSPAQVQAKPDVIAGAPQDVPPPADERQRLQKDVAAEQPAETRTENKSKAAAAPPKQEIVGGKVVLPDAFPAREAEPETSGRASDEFSEPSESGKRNFEQAPDAERKKLSELQQEADTATSPAGAGAATPSADQSAAGEGSVSNLATQRSATVAREVKDMEELRRDVGKPKMSPQEWIEHIRKLLREGKFTDARLSLNEFKKIYPNHPLPSDLKRW